MEHQNTLDARRIVIFLAFAFGIAWATALVIYLTGGLENSPELLPGVTLALALMAFPMMWAPAIANIVTHVLTHEGWRDTLLRPYIKNGAWKYWLIAWLLSPLLIFAGTALYYAVFPKHFDLTMSGTLAQVEQLMGDQAPPPDTLRMLLLLQIAVGFLTAPIINSLFTFGEEFGWRAYLQPKLMPLGSRAAMLLGGVIWGMWHWPVMLMGYEYGLDYPGAPFAGLLLFLVFAISLATIEGWLTIKSRTVWPAVITHAMTNGFGPVAMLFLSANAQPNPLLGPFPIGIIAGLPLIVFAAALLIHPTALQEPAAPTTDFPQGLNRRLP